MFVDDWKKEVIIWRLITMFAYMKDPSEKLVKVKVFYRKNEFRLRVVRLKKENVNSSYWSMLQVKDYHIQLCRNWVLIARQSRFDPVNVKNQQLMIISSQIHFIQLGYLIGFTVRNTEYNIKYRAKISPSYYLK